VQQRKLLGHRRGTRLRGAQTRVGGAGPRSGREREAETGGGSSGRDSPADARPGGGPRAAGCGEQFVAVVGVERAGGDLVLAARIISACRCDDMSVAPRMGPLSGDGSRLSLESGRSG
jgi:hypothetical protein